VTVKLYVVQISFEEINFQIQPTQMLHWWSYDNV